MTHFKDYLIERYYDLSVYPLSRQAERAWRERHALPARRAPLGWLLEPIGQYETPLLEGVWYLFERSHPWIIPSVALDSLDLTAIREWFNRRPSETALYAEMARGEAPPWRVFSIANPYTVAAALHAEREAINALLDEMIALSRERGVIHRARLRLHFEPGDPPDRR